MLNHKQQKEVYKWCLEEGLSIEYGKLSLCDLANFRHSSIYHNRRYQVHCDDSKNEFSMLYGECGPAIEKFLELKKKVKRIK